MFKDNQSIFNLFVICLTAILFNFYFGSIGVYPIDTFAFFDSSHAIIKGSLPFKDYWVMNGPILDFFQSIFFYLMGVKWYAYLLHSSLINAIFAISSYYLFEYFGLKRSLSLLYAISISILAYPVAGVPFPDHHSIIFSLIGVYFLFFAISSQKKIYWILLPIILFVAFFSKQAPAGYFIILLSISTIIYSIIFKKYDWIIPVLTSSLVLIFLLIFFLKINNINTQDFLIQYLLFPKTIGNYRFDQFNFSFIKIILNYKLIFISLLILLYIFVSNILIDKNSLIEKKTLFVVLIIMSVFISIFHQLLTKNQDFIYFLIPLICGFANCLLKKNKRILIGILISLTLFSTLKYHLRFNVDRKFMELEHADKNTYLKGEKISNILKGLKWINGEFVGTPEEEINHLKSTINHLKSDERIFVIVTNYQFLLSAIDKKNYSPNRWYTVDGVSYPLKENKYFNYYKKFYNQKLKEKKIEVVYTILPLTIETIDFLLTEKCFTSKKINPILFEHTLKDCF